MEALNARMQGWEKRGVYDDPQLTELLKLYEELGFAVRLEPFGPGMADGCHGCIQADPDRYKVLYTKKNDAE